MSRTGKIVLLAVVIVVIGAVGFASGFATRSVIAAVQSAVGPQQLPAPTVVISVETPAPPAGSETQDMPPAGSETPAMPPEQGPAATSAGQGSALDEQQMNLMREAWDLVEHDYYGEFPNNDELTDGAIRGMLDTLGDPYTAYVDPEAAAILREDESGSFEGIGAMVSMEDGILSIVSTFDGQPAEQAGLRSGDMILQVDDIKIEDMSIYEAISYIRGPANTQVRLKVLREGETEPFDVDLTRARIEVPLVESEMRADGIAYVALLGFDPNATAKLAEEIDGLLAQNPKGMILDLRGNPGGLLSESVMTPSLFLPRDTLVVIERFKDGSETRYATEERPIVPDLPLVVLVDGGSASASEIVAGALQDHGRAVLIGEKTFGKGSVQLLHDLSSGAQLRVTVARWFTPKDRAIHGDGLEPDIPVEITAEDADAGRDPQLERAVEYLLTGK